MTYYYCTACKGWGHTADTCPSRTSRVLVVGEGKRSDDVALRCARSGNPCGTDTVHNGNACACTPCRQWLAAYKNGLEAAALLAAPYHRSINGRGCPRFCSACERSREIQDAIREYAKR